MKNKNIAVGRCYCGAIKFAITLPVKFCVHCHCPFCRAMHGAAFVTWVGVPYDNFKLLGREHLKWFISSEQAKRGFCTNCGTSLLFRSVAWPDDVHVTRASLIGDVNIVPVYHIHFDQHVEWCHFNDSIPRLGGENGIQPLEAATPES